MSLPHPPRTRPPGTPVLEVLPAGTRLHRVHGPHPADGFNWTAQPSIRSGGRFDSLDGSYGYTYLGEVPDAAIAETLTRDLPLDGWARQVPRHRLGSRTLTTVVTNRDLPVLALHGAALTHVGSPLDLTKSATGEYLTTRAWAHALRTWLPEVAGFRYRCRHDEDLFADVLFDDGPTARHARARGALDALDDSTALDGPTGQHLVRAVLRAHNATLS